MCDQVIHTTLALPTTNIAVLNSKFHQTTIVSVYFLLLIHNESRASSYIILSNERSFFLHVSYTLTLLQGLGNAPKRPKLNPLLTMDQKNGTFENLKLSPLKLSKF